MSKKRILGIVILIILAVFLGVLVRRMIIINSLNSKLSKYLNNNNHYEKIINNTRQTETIIEYYCKGDKAVSFITTTNKENGSKKKLTQYFKGEITDSFIEAENNKVAMLNRTESLGKVSLTSIGYSNFGELIYTALVTPVSTVGFNDIDCYFLNSQIARNCFVEKETGLILKASGGFEIDNNGEKYNDIVEYEYDFNNVDDNIFIEPDISDYQIK